MLGCRTARSYPYGPQPGRAVRPDSSLLRRRSAHGACGTRAGLRDGELDGVGHRTLADDRVRERREPPPLREPGASRGSGDAASARRIDGTHRATAFRAEPAGRGARRLGRCSAWMGHRRALPRAPGAWPAGLRGVGPGPEAHAANRRGARGHHDPLRCRPGTLRRPLRPRRRAPGISRARNRSAYVPTGRAFRGPDRADPRSADRRTSHVPDDREPARDRYRARYRARGWRHL